MIPLKGIALAESLYGDAALRTCADLDILVHPKYLAESLRLLRSCGYEARCGEPAFVHLLARYGKDCALMREDARPAYPLQVHCGLIWGGPVERRLLDEIWSDASSRPFHAAPAYAMSPEWEFLYLAVHAARHGLFPFKWLVDLDWLSSGAPWIGKGARKGQAAGLGEGRPVLPCRLRSFAGNTGSRALCARGNSRAGASSHASGPGPLEIPTGNTLRRAAATHPLPRLRFLAIRLFVPTPADCEFLRLPSSLFFLYYFLRPWRLAGAVAGWLIQAGIARVSVRRAALFSTKPTADTPHQ